MQRAHECRQVRGRLDGVDLLDRRRLALDPGVDVPEPRVVVGRAALGDGNGNVDRKQRRDPGQPLELLASPLGRSVPPRETHRQLVAEPEDRVDGSGGFDPDERKLRPVRELCGEQSTDKRFVDLELVRVHPDRDSSAHHASRRCAFENRRHFFLSSDLARASSFRSSIASSRWSLR